MDLTDFLGRLHPLVVHLPIGFLMIAILLEIYFREKMSSGKRKSILFILVLGAVGSIFAALFGWLLAEEGGFNEDTLFWHRWSGIATVIISALALWSKYRSFVRIYITSLIGLGILLMLTGHFGGSLTHGSDYLLEPLLSDTAPQNIDYSTIPKDSLVVYRDFVRPFLTDKCTSCHNDDKQNGGLNLSTFEKLEIGGDNGKVLQSNVWESELFARVTLPQDSKKFMPPNGVPLSYNETTLLKWWIENGAGPNSPITEFNVPDDIKNILLKEYKVDMTPRPFVESVRLKPLSNSIIMDLENKGWSISLLSPNSNLLEAAPKKGKKYDTEKLLQQLLVAKNHITWLKMGNTNIGDNDLKVIGQFINLSDLRLFNTKITDEGLAEITSLSNLETLNIYGTGVTDLGLEKLSTLKSLKRIYLWKTKVTASGISELKKNMPDLKVITG